MVQQVASLKTEPAANTLPFSANTNSFTSNHALKHSFNTELLRQTEAVIRFEQPREPVRTVTNRQTETNSTRNNEFNKQQQSQASSDQVKRQREQQTQIDRQQHNEQVKKNRDKSLADREQQIDQQRAQINERRDAQIERREQQELTRNNAKKEELLEQANQRNRAHSESQLNKAQSAAQTQATNESIVENGLDQSDKVSLDTNAQNIQVSQALIDTENAAKSKEPLVTIGTEQDVFDYVDFVSQIANYQSNLENDQQPAIAIQDNGINSLIVSDQKVSTEADTQLLPDTKGNQTDVDEFMRISLTEQDLQTILDARNANVDLNAKLSQEELAKLELIVTDMLNLLHQSKTESGENTQVETTQIDKALLQNLLLNTPQPSEQNIKTKQSSESLLGVNKAEGSNDTILNVADKLTVSAVKVNQTNETEKQITGAQISNIADKNIENVSNKLIDETSTKDELIKNDLATPKIADQNQSLLKTQNDALVQDKPKVNQTSGDSNKTAIQQLINLQDEQSRSALENLSTRIQEAVSDRNTEYKGNEFIAALQSGVKEFKQQLAQGREPGLDLKAIIADALAQTNVEVNPTKQAKIDAAINQFNAVLNLSNAINYSASLQQSQVLGITDGQFIKEMGQTQLEGMKLANAANSANNQLNAQASADKAINIFKQEGQQQLAEKVRWMVNARNSSAEIRLDPPDLGGMNIKVNLNGDSAQVSFNVQSTTAKEAIDQAIPRLREILQNAGIELGESSVQQDDRKGQQNTSETGFANQQNESGKQSGSRTQTAEHSAQTASGDDTQFIEQAIVQGQVLNADGIDYYA